MSTRRAIRLRNRNRNRYVCCNNHSLYGKHGKKLIRLECTECQDWWHDCCCIKNYGWTNKDVKKKNFRCPDCIAFEDDINSYKKSKTKKKSKKKSRKHHSSHVNYGDSSANESSNSDMSIISSNSDSNKKKVTSKSKLKKQKQKEKAIKNRLNNIDQKYKFEYSKEMLNISDSGTDDDFDATLYYPDKMPKSDKALENLRSKTSKKKNQIYYKPKKNTEYYSFEKQLLIDLIYAIAAKPKQFNYNPRFGWCATDISHIAAMFLYELRKKEPKKYINIPMRNAASIKAKFKTWDETANKENNKEKEWISKYESAKEKLIDLSKKAASDVNEELINFGQEYSKTRLKNVQNQLKKIQTEKKNSGEISNMFASCLSGVGDLIKDLKNDQKNVGKNVANPIQSGTDNYDNSVNPYYDEPLMNSLNKYSPANNQKFISKYNSETTTNIGPGYNDDNDNIDKCLKFVTQMSNSPKSAFDEDDEQTQQETLQCERALFDDNKAQKLGKKFTALDELIPKLTNKQKLHQLARVAAFL